MHRRGFTLIEMVISITAASALMGIAVCLLCVLMGAEGGGREHLQRGDSLARLADRFRRDVHAAVDAPAKLPDRPAAWDFPLAADGFSHYVRYEADGGFITCNRRESGAAPRWETYALPENSSVSIETEPAGAGTLVRLTITPKDVAGRKIRVEAVLGRDHRFTKKAEGSE